MSWYQKAFWKNMRLFVLFLSLLALIFVVHTCKEAKTESDYVPIEPVATHVNGTGYAGSESCVTCHNDIYQTHIKTAHYNTSAIADTASVKGDFGEGKNSFDVGKSFRFTLKSTDTALYEQVHRIDGENEISKSKIDMVIGSGTKGQSYLSWKEDRLVQLQTSYFAPTDEWINSPGYEDHYSPDRPIRTRCLECHTTYAENKPIFRVQNSYDKKQLLYGIDCERCHGPSAEHVGFHRSNPEVLEANFMLRFKEMSRQQRLDVCALCHSGVRAQAKKPPFGFMTGDKLSDFSATDYKDGDEIDLDVHGNQYGLLTSSQCYEQTETMDCTTCHDPHKKERGTTDAFNQKCVGCHTGGKIHCTESKALLSANGNNCIQCHMPLSPSKTMRVQIDGDTVPVMVRTHLIDIYMKSL